MFGLGLEDIMFGHDPRIRVCRQVKIVGDRQHFAPVKNRKEHSVPAASWVAAALVSHLEWFPAVEVALPWHDPRDRDRHGKSVTLRLILTDGHSRALHRSRFNDIWHAVQERAAVTPKRTRGQRKGSRAPGRLPRVAAYCDFGVAARGH